MGYASVDDITSRCRRTMSEGDAKVIELLIDDAAIIIDTYNAEASTDAKKLVTCNMVVRAMGTDEDVPVPIGTTQGTVSALGYSQSWTMGSGSTGELYLSKLDKKLLGAGRRIAFKGPLEDCDERDNSNLI